MDKNENIREIVLTQGKVAIVDASMYEFLSKWKWHICNGYAARRQWTKTVNGRRTSEYIYMHRVINETLEGMSTDHINGNQLDNRKSNLRDADQSQNNANQKIRKSNSSGYRGVSWSKQKGKWCSEITKYGKKKNLGFYCDIRDAANAYDKASQELFGVFARNNAMGAR